MYSGNNEAGDLEVLEIKIFFAAQPWWADFIEFLKNSFSGFLHFGDGISENFLKKR